VSVLDICSQCKYRGDPNDPNDTRTKLRFDPFDCFRNFKKLQNSLREWPTYAGINNMINNSTPTIVLAFIRGFMPVLALFLAALCAGCSTPQVLTYGTKMNAVEKGWGKPDDTMAYQDYKATGNYSIASVGGSWSPQGGSVSGFSYGETYIKGVKL
jgi:hypothetical protein